MKDENKNENTTAYVQSKKDIENAVKAIFEPMKNKYVTITSLSDSLANIVANFTDVAEVQTGIGSVQVCGKVAKNLLAIASKKFDNKRKGKGKK